MWELWFLGTHGQWEYVDQFDKYEDLIESCISLKQYARVVLQILTGHNSASLTLGYTGTTRTAVNLSLISPNAEMQANPQ